MAYVYLQILTLAVLTFFLILHDVIPLGRWNNVSRADGQERNLGGTFINAAVGLVPLYFAWTDRHVHGLTGGRRLVIIVLSVVLFGALYSWWSPWLFGTSERRKRELCAISDGTLKLVPDRHGVNPNALHCAIHLLTLGALLESIALIWV